MSTGHVHVAAGLDPHGKINFHPAISIWTSWRFIVPSLLTDLYLHRLADVVTLRWAYKKLREHTRRMKLYRGEILSSHPKFPKGSAAETRSTAMPVEITAPDIVYTKEDDEAIERFYREIGEIDFCVSELNLFFALSSATISGGHSVCSHDLSMCLILAPTSFQCGTCAMKPRDQGGVVDERLNVYGIQNLKVAGV